MEIEMIAGKKVKISPHSITVKNDIGKTAGVVRGTSRFKDLQPNKQIDFWKIICKCGIWGSRAGLLDNVVFRDGEMYYLHDLRPLETYERLFKKDPDGWESETKKYNQRKTAAEEMAKYCTVIPCYIIK